MRLRAVVDTSVLISGFAHRGPAGEIVEAWAAQRFMPCVSTALALEYEAVLMRKGTPEKKELKLKALQALLKRAEYVPVRYTYRPVSPDPGDDMVVDCVLNSASSLVTENTKDFRNPARQLGFSLYDASTFLALLRKETGP